MSRNAWVKAVWALAALGSPGCVDELPTFLTPAPASVDGSWRGTFSCGEVAGEIGLWISRGDEGELSGLVRLHSPVSGVPSHSRSYQATGISGPEGEFRLAGSRSHGGDSPDLPGNLFPLSLELEGTFVEVEQRLRGTLEPCGGSFFAGRVVLTGFK